MTHARSDVATRAREARERRAPADTSVPDVIAPREASSRAVRDGCFEYHTTGDTSQVWRNVYCVNVGLYGLMVYTVLGGGFMSDIRRHTGWASLAGVALHPGSRQSFRLFATHDESNRNMLNADGENVDLYIPRKCSWTNRLITASDKASVQLNVGHLDANGVYNGSYTTMALSGYVRMKVGR